MIRTTNVKKKALAVAGAIVAIAVALPMFAAFEAHVINVKAHIENALKVSPPEIDFGTVFPQESLNGTFAVALSDSFMDSKQRRVQDVEYKIVQKRKPKKTANRLDVIFVFDLTGSMGGALDDAKTKSKDIMDLIGALSPDVQFGVTSIVDYPHAYDSYGYSATYGAVPDYAYNRDAALSADKNAIKTTINGLSIFSGGDGPQDYTRAMYESYADGAIGWRAGAEHIVILISDNLPHDNDVNEGVPGKFGAMSTGGDPGRDEVMFTADDLDLQVELANMTANGKKLYSLHYGPYLDYWQEWSGRTGGSAVDPAAFGSIVDGIKELFTYKDLRPFLYKNKAPEEEDKDSEEAASLDKSINDIVDNWQVRLDVPCIMGALCQGHGVHTGVDECPSFPCGGPRFTTCQSIPETAAGSGDAGDWGADIWVEVTGLSYVRR